MMEWISVDDRLPEYRETVLMWVDCYEVGFCERGNWYYMNMDRAYPDYWAQLPEPPKDMTNVTIQ